MGKANLHHRWDSSSLVFHLFQPGRNPVSDFHDLDTSEETRPVVLSSMSQFGSLNLIIGFRVSIFFFFFQEYPKVTMELFQSVLSGGQCYRLTSTSFSHSLEVTHLQFSKFRYM